MRNTCELEVSECEQVVNEIKFKKERREKFRLEGMSGL